MTTSEHTGTPRYLAPELVMSEENVYPTTASDVYTLGCLGLEVRYNCIIFLPPGVALSSNQSKKFLYDRKPYENRANNLRGQIIDDLKRGVPPSTMPPRQHWSISRIWPLITHIWSLNPHHRPPASSLAHLVKHALRSIPLNIMQCMADFVDIPERDSLRLIPLQAWQERTRHVRALCLASKAFWVLATPLLYGDIIIDRRTNWPPVTRLIYALNNSTVNPLPFSTTPFGCGTHTKYFSLFVELDVAHNIRAAELGDALCMMTKLQVALIFPLHSDNHSIPVSAREVKVGGLRSLVHNNGNVSHLLKQQWISRAMPFLQSLYIRDCVPTWEQNGFLFIPELQEIYMFGAMCSVVTSWEIPSIKRLGITFGSGYKPIDLTNLLRKVCFFPLIGIYLRQGTRDTGDTLPVSQSAHA
jgi:serine/threonine protein kinase